MQLQHITLHDFRTYGGRQTIELSPTSSDKPVILFGGLNGAGKTTLLDALQLVLYGMRARCASRGNLAYKTYLREAIHRNSDPDGGASIELAFSHASEGKQRIYIVRRSWYPTSTSVSEHVEVEVDGALDPVLTDHWDERVDDFAPHRISNLFFFDGEKLDELTVEETSADILRTAIHSLLGLDLVDRLVGDLAVLDQKKRREAGADVDRTDSQQAEEERTRITGELEAATSSRAALMTRFDREGAVREKSQRAYREEGGELADGRIALEADLARLIGSRDELRAKLQDAALSTLPLALVADSLRELNLGARQSMELQDAVTVAKVLIERDELVLRVLADNKAAKKAITAVSNALEADRHERMVEDTRSGLGLAREDARDLDRLVAAELPSEMKRCQEIHEEIDHLTEAIVLAERRLQAIPEEGTLGDLRDAKASAEASCKATEAELAVLEERIRRLKGQSEASTERLRRALERELDHFKEGDKGRRKLERAQEASATLEAFRERILRDNIQRVEVAVLESFQHIVRKPGLVKSLSIDPESFEIRLVNDRGLELKRGQLSAGESQLLAVAILWGLAKTAGLPLPVVIDTPLGRLDSKHRTKLMEQYFPQASHQVLLLSTDEEIREQRLEDLEPHISRSYLLAYDDEQDQTVIEEGYFQHQE